MTASTTSTTFNGWTNYETWNVALYIQNDFGLYTLAQECETYEQFVDTLTECGTQITDDGVSYTHPTLDTDELDELISEI